MRAAIYARVSTPRQARDGKTDQELRRLEHYAERKGWATDGGRIYLDEGYSGASLSRPGLDALRDAVAMAEFEVVLVATPDRLALAADKGSRGRVRKNAHRREDAPRAAGEVALRTAPALGAGAFRVPH